MILQNGTGAYGRIGQILHRSHIPSCSIPSEGRRLRVNLHMFTTRQPVSLGVLTRLGMVRIPTEGSEQPKRKSATEVGTATEVCAEL